MAMQESGEMYLETILILSKNSSFVRSIDVGDYMGFSKPSVSRAIGILKADGYINVSGGGAITLTPSGYDTAVHIYDRHTTLTQALIHLGVDEKIAADDACRIEHYISDETFAAIKKHISRKE